jgi:branched-chain amino acid transport system ATP-binding protein
LSSILSLRGLSKSFGAVVVADALDLQLREGEALGILGPNGAGKTTLFGMISGAVRADAGAVEFEGRDVSRLPAMRRARLGMTRTFQVPRPFGGMSVFENLVVAAASVRSVRESEVYDLAACTLSECDLLERANQRAGTLTLLDRKRLELARALVTRPRLLLLDEVAGGLSEPECEALVGLVHRVRESGVSIMWIEHIMHALVAVVDRIVVLAGGRFIADDRPDAVLGNPKVAEIYMGVPAGV